MASTKKVKTVTILLGGAVMSGLTIEKVEDMNGKKAGYVRLYMGKKRLGLMFLDEWNKLVFVNLDKYNGEKIYRSFRTF